MMEMIFDNSPLPDKNIWDMFEMNEEPVTEKYVGNSAPEFKVIEGELKKIIQLIKKEYGTLIDGADLLKDSSSAAKITNSDFNKMIERNFKKLFGLKGFRLMWTNGSPNAMTMPGTFTFLNKGTNKDGKYTNKNLKIGVMIDIGLVLYCEMNEVELLAIILHEIGHNFYNSIFQTLAHIPIGISISPFGNIKKKSIWLWSIIRLLNGNNGGFSNINLRSKIDAWIDENAPIVAQIYNFNKKFIYNISTLLGIASLPGLIKNFKAFLQKQIISFRSVFGYNMEKFADSFAVDHGYGTELASALDKLKNPKHTVTWLIVDNVVGLNWVVDIFNVSSEILLSALDEHPSNQNRIRTGLDRLKRSAKDPKLDPEIREDLEKQIESYEKYYYEQYLNPDSDENKKKTVSVLTRIGIEKVFGGKMDIRELIYALDPKKYS